MTTAYYYPAPGFEVPFPKHDDPPLPAAGAFAEVSDYLTNHVLAGSLLDYDPDGAIESTAPIMGTASNTSGLVITIDYPNGLHETVYQLGAFTPLYSAGSTINLSTGAYSILRAGGFPFGVSVTSIGCAPCPPIPTGGQSLGTIYEVDFRTLPNLTIGPVGSYVIDGKVWWAKGPLIANGSNLTSSIQNGAGMRFTTDKTYDLPAAGDMSCRSMFLPLANISGYNPLAPIVVRAKFIRGAVPISGMIGLVNTTADAANYLAAQRATEVFCGPEQAGGNTSSIKSKYGTGGQNGISSGQVSTPPDNFFCGIWEMFPGYRDICTQVWDGTGAIPPMTSIPQRQGLGMLTSSNVNTTICLTASSNFGQPETVWVTHLSISQPKVP